MPMFGKQSHSLRNVPNWESATKMLSEANGMGYEIQTTQVMPTIYGGLTAEVARDKNHLTMLAPSSINAKAKFHTFLTLSLNSMGIGSSQEAKGGAIMGHEKNAVSKLFVDNFVNCMRTIYSVPPEKIKARVHEAIIFPIILVSDPLTMIIAPIRMQENLQWQTGKYSP